MRTRIRTIIRQVRITVIITRIILRTNNNNNNDLLDEIENDIINLLQKIKNPKYI